MSTLRRRLVGSGLFALAALSFAFAATVVPTLATGSAGDPGLVTPSPLTGILSPAAVALGSVLLVGGVAALSGADLSARGALFVPVTGVVAAVGLAVVSGADPAAPAEFTALVDPSGADADSPTAVLLSSYAGIAAGAVVGGTIAPVVRATVTEDTVALLVGALVLLAAIAAASGSPLALAAGGVGGAVAVGALWVADPATWRP